VSDAVKLGYELNDALTVYLDAKAIEDGAGYQGYAVQAQSELIQILWDNKAGIIAHLLSGAMGMSPEEWEREKAIAEGVNRLVSSPGEPNE
jgi:hypothetical protein